MKIESADKLKSLMISTYKKKGDNTALLIKVGEKRTWTGNEIVKEIEDETDFGIKLVNNIVQLSIDLLSRDKLNIDEYEQKTK